MTLIQARENQLSLFDGATIDPRTNPSERDLEIASNRESLVKIFFAATENVPGKIAPPGQPALGFAVARPGRPSWAGGTVENFIAAYNNEAFPHIFSILGKVSRSTLYGWVRDYREGGFDALIPLYKVRSPKVSRAEDRCLRELLLDHISIGQAIFITKYFLKRRKTESPSSPATLRRWAKRIMNHDGLRPSLRLRLRPREASAPEGRASGSERAVSDPEGRRTRDDGYERSLIP